jgi:diguanylate cyclase (GGDEF)-like protein
VTKTTGGPHRTFGLFFPCPAGPYLGPLAAAVTLQLEHKGYQVVRYPVPAAGTEDSTEAGSWPSQIGLDYLDGIIAVQQTASGQQADTWAATGKPLVAISGEQTGPNRYALKPDSTSGIARMVAHLAKHGRRRIAFAGQTGQFGTQERYEAYKEALAQLGLPPTPFIPLGTGGTQPGGQTVLAQLLSTSNPPDAVVADSDTDAVLIAQQLQAAGYRIPSDIAATGYGNTAAAASYNPPLSTIDPNYTQIGKLAADIILAAAAGRPAPSPQIPPATLVLRGSCGCEPACRPGTQAGIARDLAAAINPHSPDVANRARQLTRQLAADLASASPHLSPGTLAALGRLIVAQPDEHGILAIITASHRLASQTQPAGPAGLLTELGQACTQLARQHRQDQPTPLQQLNLSLGLLHDLDPRQLRWLVSSQIHAACLGLWDNPQPGSKPSHITLGGTHNLQPASNRWAPGQFPPPELLQLAATHPGRATWVLPVRTDEHNWGALALVTTNSGTDSKQETYPKWAELLAAALDQLATVNKLRQQHQQLAHSHKRERYALAALTANDGMWDWDLTTGRVYYSARCAQILGLGAQAVTGSIKMLARNTNPDDAGVLLASLRDSRGQPAGYQPPEIELRIPGPANQQRWVLCRAVVAPGHDGPPSRIVGSIMDITARKNLEHQLRYQALHDELTGLPNRALLQDRLEQAIALHQRDPKHTYAVLMIDLDRFKDINDSMGHAAGNKLLQQIGTNLSSTLRRTDTLARVGGDEFVALVDGLPSADTAYLDQLVQRLQTALTQPYTVEDQEITISGSVGMVASSERYTNADDILRDADTAMYQAKHTERGSLAIFSSSMHDDARRRLELGTQLRQSLAQGQLQPYYQPVVELGKHRWASLEALIRWHKLDGTIATPDEFLPIAEEIGLMPQIGRAILQQVCRQIAEWDQAGLLPPSLKIAVNTSHWEFWHGTFLTTVDEMLATNHTDPSRLILEITENVILRDPPAGITIANQLRRRGITLHIDDFGAGRSSLEALRELPLDAIKIDRSFVTGLGSTHKGPTLAKAIIKMGQTLELAVIAEGVETKRQLQTLRQLGCKLGQGYLLARPMPPDQIAAQLEHNSTTPRRQHRPPARA